MNKPLQVGVIGLGRRWRKHYQPALAALRKHLQPRFVCDPVHARALRAAQQVGAEAVLDAGEMLANDVDALLLLDPPWYGLWPIEQACRSGKPVFCAMPLERDDAHADAVCQSVRERQLPVMMGMALHFCPVLDPLRQLLGDMLGLRLLLWDLALPERPGPLACPVGIGTAVVDVALSLLEGEPARVEPTGGQSETARGIAFHYPNGRAVQFRWYRAKVSRPILEMKLIADNGYVKARLPRRMAWTDATGRHVFVAPRGRPLGEVLLERFANVVRGRQPPEPSLEDAYRALGWLRLVKQADDFRS
jgi:predicted dehydrogenase